MIDAVVKRGVYAAADMRDAREVNHAVATGEQRHPVDVVCEVVVMDYLRPGYRREAAAMPHGGADQMTVRGEGRHKRAADKAVCACDQHTHQGLLAARLRSKTATSAPPIAWGWTS